MNRVRGLGWTKEWKMNRSPCKVLTKTMIPTCDCVFWVYIDVKKIKTILHAILW